MLTLNEIKERLQDRNISVIADKTGLNVATIHKIKRSDKANPTYETIKILSDYLEQNR